MSVFTEVRLGDLSSAVTITRGFPTPSGGPGGDVPVMSVADLRNDSAPRHFADHGRDLDGGTTGAEAGMCW